jgi:hypothetical protein
MSVRARHRNARPGLARPDPAGRAQAAAGHCSPRCARSRTGTVCPGAPVSSTTRQLGTYICIEIFPSRRIQKALVDEVPFRVLAAGNQPVFRTIFDFRRICRKAPEAYFEQVLDMGLTMGANKLTEWGFGRQQGQSERVQAQCDELRTDEGAGKLYSSEKGPANCCVKPTKWMREKMTMPPQSQWRSRIEYRNNSESTVPPINVCLRGQGTR